jgi:esterase/lipase
MRKNKKLLPVFLGALGGLFGALVLIILFLYAYPINVDSLVSQPRPSQSFEESLQRIDMRRKAESEIIDPSGRTMLMDHGKKVERVIVFFHGFTKSPRQFEALGAQFYNLGYNVYIPRIPYHGYKKFMSAHLERLTAQDLAQASDEAVDIAQGLGEHVTVAGISMGGVMAGWVAQLRHDVDQAVIIAPSFGINNVPNCFLKPSINFLTIAPSFFIWWDSQKKNNLDVPQATYYGFPSRAIGEVFRLGWDVQILEKKSRAAAHSILIITNANDHAVSKEEINVVIHNWQKYDISQIQSYEFSKKFNVGHDLIDPQQPDQNVSAVYPKLISLIRGGTGIAQVAQ